MINSGFGDFAWSSLGKRLAASYLTLVWRRSRLIERHADIPLTHRNAALAHEAWRTAIQFVAARRVRRLREKMNIIIDLKKNAALPHRISLSQNVPTAPDVKKRARPTGLTRAEVRKAVEQMIG